MPESIVSPSQGLRIWPQSSSELTRGEWDRVARVHVLYVHEVQAYHPLPQKLTSSLLMKPKLRAAKTILYDRKSALYTVAPELRMVFLNQMYR